MVERSDETTEPDVVVDEVPVESTTAHSVAVEGPVTAHNLWSHQHAHPYILSFKMFKHFSPQWLTWEEETLPVVVRTAFACELSELNLHKLQAMRALHVSDAFWEQYEIFTFCAKALTGTVPNFDVMQIITLPEAAIAIDIAAEVRDDIPYSDEVVAMLRALFDYEGVYYTPDPFKFVKLDEHAFLDTVILEDKFASHVRTGKLPDPNTVEDVQVNKLAEIYAMRMVMRARLDAQKALLK